MTVGCLEPQFFKAFIDKFNKALPHGFDFEDGWRPTPNAQADTREWPKMRSYFEKGFLTNTREYWTDVFHGVQHLILGGFLFLSLLLSGTDACAVPVLMPPEATAALESSPMPEFHPRVVRHNGHDQYSPSSHKHLDTSKIILQPGLHTEELLTEAGLSDREIKKLALEGALGKEAQKTARSNVKL